MTLPPYPSGDPGVVRGPGLHLAISLRRGRVEMFVRPALWIRHALTIEVEKTQRAEFGGTAVAPRSLVGDHVAFGVAITQPRSLRCHQPGHHVGAIHLVPPCFDIIASHLR